jgi:hypothetical protein
MRRAVLIAVAACVFAVWAVAALVALGLAPESLAEGVSQGVVWGWGGD